MAHDFSVSRIPAILSFIIWLLTSCGTIPTPQVVAIPSRATEEVVVDVTPTSTLGHVSEAQCERPYAETSIWNLPIDWSKAKIHPDSGLMMEAFFHDEKWIGSDTNQYSPNIYYVTNKTPAIPVKLHKNRFRDAIDDEKIRYGEPGGIVWMPIPFGARPALGTDGQLVIINLDSGEEWGLNKGSIADAGQWYAGGAYRYHIQNSGIPPDGFGQRGAGIGQFAGIVRPCEVEREYIGHAVTLAYDFPCAPITCEANGWLAFIPPFTKTDGDGRSRYDIPEGARLVIRPEVSEEDIQKACLNVKGCIVWTLNMQKYGGFIVDNSDHPKTGAEGNATAHWDSEVWFSDMLRHIPTDWYAVIDWNYPSTKTSVEE